MGLVETPGPLRAGCWCGIGGEGAGGARACSRFCARPGVISHKTLNLADVKDALSTPNRALQTLPPPRRCRHPPVNVSRHKGSVPRCRVTSAPLRLRGSRLLRELAGVQGAREAPRALGRSRRQARERRWCSLWELAGGRSLGRGPSFLGPRSVRGPPLARGGVPPGLLPPLGGPPEHSPRHAPCPGAPRAPAPLCR